MTNSAAWHTCTPSWLQISRDGEVGLISGHREGPRALGRSLAAAELHLGHGISSHRVGACSNFLSGSASQGLGGARRLKPSLAAIRQQPLCLRRVRVGNKLENNREEAVGSSPEEKAEEGQKSVDKKEGGFVERVEEELGRQFGGAIWFSVLLLSLALFGGLYVSLIVNYGDFSDIPIFRGPQR